MLKINFKELSENKAYSAELTKQIKAHNKALGKVASMQSSISTIENTLKSDVSKITVKTLKELEESRVKYLTEAFKVLPQGNELIKKANQELNSAMNEARAQATRLEEEIKEAVTERLKESGDYDRIKKKSNWKFQLNNRVGIALDDNAELREAKAKYNELRSYQVDYGTIDHDLEQIKGELLALI